MIFGEESPHTKKIKVTQNIFIRDAMMEDRTDQATGTLRLIFRAWCHVTRIYCLPFIKKLITPKMMTKQKKKRSVDKPNGCLPVPVLTFCHTKLKKCRRPVNNGPQISSCLIVTLEMYTTPVLRPKSKWTFFVLLCRAPPKVSKTTTTTMGDMHDTLSATETRTHRAPFTHIEESNRPTRQRPRQRARRRDAH